MSRSEELPLLENDDKDVFPLEESQAVAADLISDDQQSASVSASEDNDAKIFRYDVFISYSKSDRPWVKDVLLQILEKEGKKVCIDYRDFQIGETVTDNIVHAIENSHVTILVLTPSFVESDWCMYESKHALVSSLNKSRARVLPLILMECHIPNILKHLTYLDHTSEDVQPYFKEQLINSLDNAKKWIPPKDHLGCDIVPVSEVRQVVKRTIDRVNLIKRINANTTSKLTNAYLQFDSKKDLAIFIIAIPYCLVLFLIMVLFIIATVSQKKSVMVMRPVSIRGPSQSFAAFPLLTKDFQSFSITKKNSEKPILFDAYGFKEEGMKILYVKVTNSSIYTSLPQQMFYKPKNLRVYGDMSVGIEFCFHSKNSNASLRLYKPTSGIASKQFDRSSISNPEIIFGLKYSDFTSPANIIICDFFVINGRDITDNDVVPFVFYNLGRSPISLGLKTEISEISYRKSLAIHTCRNVTKCNPPSSGYMTYIITKNTSAPLYFWNDTTVKLNYRMSILLRSVIGMTILILAVFILKLIIRCLNKNITPRLRKWYFEREKFRKRLRKSEVQILINSSSIDDFFKLYKEDRGKKSLTA